MKCGPKQREKQTIGLATWALEVASWSPFQFGPSLAQQEVKTSCARDERSCHGKTLDRGETGYDPKTGRVTADVTPCNTMENHHVSWENSGFIH